MEDPTVAPPDTEPRFQVGAVITHPGAVAALDDGPGDLLFELLGDHLRHAEPYADGWLSGVRYRGAQLAVATVTALKETHVFAASEAREVGEEVRARTGRMLLI